jgi:hypothetical protein
VAAAAAAVTAHNLKIVEAGKVIALAITGKVDKAAPAAPEFVKTIKWLIVGT